MKARLVARAVRGLEWAAAAEISSRLPEAAGIGLSTREITFRLPALTPQALGLRIADDLFLEVGRIPGVGPARDVPSLAARRIAALDWAGALARLGSIRPLPDRPRFDVVASLEGRRNYNRFAVENAVGAALQPVLHGSHLARSSAGRQPGEPDLTVRIFVHDAEARAALRLAERPLHRRSYKQDTGAGTLHPPVAAALAWLADPVGAATAADPFCGDGTIAIETSFCYPTSRVLASDIDPVRLRNTGRNAARAGFQLSLERIDAGYLPWPRRSVDAVITNPPWNVAVNATGQLRRSLDRFWRQLPPLLAPGGRLCLIADAELGAPGRLRQMGYQLVLATQIRVAGRVSHLLLGAPGGLDPPQIPAALAWWRERARTDGVITETGF